MPDVASAPTRLDRPFARASAAALQSASGQSSPLGRYAIGAEIARGGMGRVVAATDTVLGRNVAVKVTLTDDEDLRARFRRETRITARLEHPAIVPVYDAGTSATGSLYYVMRKVSGKPLEALVADAETLPQRLALLPHLLAAVNAVAHAHSRNVLHRDLKPSNILVGALGETVVIDWGLAKTMDADEDPAPPERVAGPAGADDVGLTRIGSVVGTPGFMPPEQVRGEPVDTRADVYALGASLYYLLCRRPPHVRPTGDGMLEAALAGPPTPVRKLVPGVAPELATIVDKALAYRADDRHRDAGELAEDLTRFLAGQLVASHRYSPRERLVRFLRRHRVPVVIATVSLVAITIASWAAIRSVVVERARTKVALRAALDRNDMLELARARGLLTTSPTTALALIKPLASRYWREAAAIALAARAIGVARGLPASPRTLSIELSRDGQHALTGGDDGVVRIYDLATRRMGTIANLDMSVRATFAENERAIVAWTDKGIEIRELRDGTVRDVAAPAPPVAVHAAGTTLWWFDTAGAVWSCGLDDTVATAHAIDDRITSMALSDGAVALGGEHHLWVVRGATATRVADGKVTAVAWSPDGRLGAIVGQHVLELDASDHVAFDTERPTARSLAWQGGALYVGITGGVVRRDAAPIQFTGNVNLLLPAPGDALVVRNESNGLAVIDPHVTITVPPTSSTAELAASPNSHYLVAGSDGILLVWDLDHVLPRAISLGNGSLDEFSEHEQMVVPHEDGTATWIDLRTKTKSTYRVESKLTHAAFSRDGTRAVLSEAEGRCMLYVRGQAAGTRLDAAGRMAVFMGDDRIVFASPTGVVRLYDPKLGQSTLLYQAASGPYFIQAAGDWAAIVFADNSVWRMNLVTRATTQLRPSSSQRWIFLRDNGDTVVTDLATMRLWKASGTFVDGPVLPRPVRWMIPVGADHILVLAGYDSRHLVELSTMRATAVYPPGSRLHTLRFEGDLGVFVDDGEAINETAPFVRTSWTVARPTKLPLRWPVLSADRSELYGLAGGTLLIWKQPIVTTPEQTLALIEDLTNATVTANGPAGEPGWLRWTE